MIAATLSPVLGLVCSLIAWLVTAKKQGGVSVFKASNISLFPSPNHATCLANPLLEKYSTARRLPARANSDSEIIDRTSPSLAQAASQSRQDFSNPTMANIMKVTPCWRVTSLRYFHHASGCHS